MHCDSVLTYLFEFEMNTEFLKFWKKKIYKDKKINTLEIHLNLYFIIIDSIDGYVKIHIYRVFDKAHMPVFISRMQVFQEYNKHVY